MNNVTTSGLTSTNNSKSVKIESKKIMSQCIPYFFSIVKKDNKNPVKSSKINVKKCE